MSDPVDRNDPSNGYEAIANQFIDVRSVSGRAVIRAWIEDLAPGASILDLGAGSGEPITSVLIEAGFDVVALDASPAMSAAFKQNFPEVPFLCEPAETSDFFGRRFDAILAVGLVFLLPEDTQRDLIQHVYLALTPGGSFLFSAPVETGEWDDVLTGQRSRSLGMEAYSNILRKVGFARIESRRDEAGSHYYLAAKP